jgi:uncharacterized protein YgiM (DUF1202 family)
MLFGNKVNYYFNIDIKCLLCIFFLLILTNSCTKAPTGLPQPKDYYVIPDITYLRENPGYDEKVISQLYQGDQVLVVEDGEAQWWRVQQLSNGQTGWLQKVLLSEVPVPSNFYYITQDNVPLLKSPKKESPSIVQLSKGERVTKLEEKSPEWWRIKIATTGMSGWVPAAALSRKPMESQAGHAKEFYYVTLRNLALRARPWIKDESIKTLHFNDQVQKITEGSQGWFKVRIPADGMQGWVLGRYLDKLPAVAPREDFRLKSQPNQLKQKKEVNTEPEIM